MYTYVRVNQIVMKGLSCSNDLLCEVSINPGDQRRVKFTESEAQDLDILFKMFSFSPNEEFLRIAIYKPHFFISNEEIAHIYIPMSRFPQEMTAEYATPLLIKEKFIVSRSHSIVEVYFTIVTTKSTKSNIRMIARYNFSPTFYNNI